MKKVTVVGVGMGPDTITQEGLRAVRQADALIGAPRLLSLFAGGGKPAFAEYLPEPVAKAVRESDCRSFAVLVSGDTGFYSAAEGLCAALAEYELTLIPGVSSLSCFFARLKRPWQEAALVSCHGRTSNLADTVRRSRLTFVLTGGNMAQLAQTLSNAGFGYLRVQAGENLGAENERLWTCRADELAKAGAALTILLIENPAWDDRVRFGIPDEEFLRGGVPMTKEEVRAVTMSRLSPRPEAVCWDIGAGTGSVTVELALAAYRGQVYAVDKNEEALHLIRANCRAFHIGNVTPVLGDAPSMLDVLPPPDTAFIGGSGGRLREILAALLHRNPHVRVAVNAIALESTYEALSAFAENGLTAEAVQISAARCKSAGSLHLLMAQNPVFVISGGRNG